MIPWSKELSLALMENAPLVTESLGVLGRGMWVGRQWWNMGMEFRQVVVVLHEVWANILTFEVS